MDALSHIPWEDYYWHIEADTIQALIFKVTLGATLIEVYSCNIQVTETSDIQKDPKVISQKDWITAQSQDPMIRDIKFLISQNNLKEW